MLTESMIVDLVPKIGQRANFLDQLEKLKKPIEVNIYLFNNFICAYYIKHLGFVQYGYLKFKLMCH